MKFSTIEFSMIVLLMASVFTKGTNRAAELTEDAMISADGRSLGYMLDSIVSRMAASNVQSTNLVVNDVDRCQMGSADIIIGEEVQISAMAERAAVLISAAADRCATRIEQIIQQLVARLVGTAGSAIAVANSQIKLATGQINAITDRTVTEAQLIARSALVTAERTIGSTAKLAVAIAESDITAVKDITDIAGKRSKVLAEGLAGGVSIATIS